MKRHGPFRLRRDVVRVSYDIHSWLGILGGMAFFICCFSGSLALFERDLVAWETPEIRFEDEGEQLSVDELLAKAQAQLGDDKDFFVALPTEQVAVLQARAFTDGQVEELTFDPYTGTAVDTSQETAFEFLTHLHTDLHLPRPIGRYLVGFLGIVLLMSLCTGVMTHTRFIKDMFRLRWRPRLRLTFSDLHKQVGVWGLVFGLVMAFTGAVIGLLGLFAPVMVLSAFGGDVGKATEAFSGPSVEETGNAAAMLPLVPLIEGIEDRNPGFRVQSLFVRHWGDAAAEVALNLEPTPYRKLVAGETHRLSLIDGETLHISRFTERGLGSRLFGAMQPVHYALFGGLGLKLVYLLSGMALSFGIATGSVIWLARRRPAADERAARRGQYFWLSRLHLGVCLGLVVASALAIGAGRLAPNDVEVVFWLAWLAVFGGAFLVRSSLGALRVGGFATAAVLAAIAVFDLLVSSALPTAALNVDLALLSVALLTAAGASFIPRRPRAARAADAPGSIPLAERPGT